jgi:hypothetical protein
MADQSKNGDLPRFVVPEKKVDTSWKEEMRREREAAKAKAAAEPSPAAGEKGSAAGGAGPTETSKVFVNFVAGLIQQVLMQLGKMENPFAAGGEIDLEGARYTIDLLGVLQEKTKGNLSAKESQILAESIRDLRLHYVETVKAVESQVNKQPQPGAEPK